MQDSVAGAEGAPETRMFSLQIGPDRLEITSKAVRMLDGWRFTLPAPYTSIILEYARL